MKNLLFPICILITLYSCTNPISSNIHTKNVNFGDVRKVKTSDLISEIDFIKLETNSNSRFGKIDQIIIYNNKVYILDSYQSSSLLVFSIEGKFINKIMKVGRGPGEYLTASCFGIDEKNELILLFDRQQNKILRYRIDNLSYVDDIRIPVQTPATFMFNAKENLYYYYYAFKGNNKHIAITTGNGKVVNNLIDAEPAGRILHGCQCNFYHFNDDICIFPYFSNKIFTVNRDTAYVKYELTFGKNKMPDKELFINSDNSGVIMKELMSGDDGRIRMLIPYESEDRLLVKYYIKQDVFIGIWQKEMNQVVNFKYSEVSDNMGIGGKFPFPIGVFKDKFIGEINTYDIDSSNVKNGQLKRQLENTSTSDNPILILFK